MSVDVDDFFGGRICVGGIVFQGQIQSIFSQSVKRYLIAIVHEKFQRWKDAADDYPSDFWGPSLERVAGQLWAFAARICQYAVETDRRLRGSGKPEKVQPYNASWVHSSVNAEILRLQQAFRVTLRREVAAAADNLADYKGAFIPTGGAFSVLVSLSKILSLATKEVFIVDPYLDEIVLTGFAILPPETVQIKLLSDKRTVKPSLAPAVKRWKTQFTNIRPLDARFAPDRTLHDRLLVIDRKDVWVLTQSLNAFAQRSPASIVSADAEAAQLHVTAYDDIFASASPL